MTISFHDGVINGYSVNFLENVLLLDIQTVVDETLTVTFQTYLAHNFNYVMAGSIIFDIEAVELKSFFIENSEQFETYKLYAWPIWDYKEINELEHYLQENNYTCYVISASLELTGYVFAKSLTIKVK